MNESQFYRTLVEATPKNWMWQRIETSTASGVPDVNLFIPEMGELWIETKLTKSKKTILRSAQYAWVTKRWFLGGRALIVSRDRHIIQIWSSPLAVAPTTTEGRLMITSPPDETCTIVNFMETIKKILTSKPKKIRKEKYDGLAG